MRDAQANLDSFREVEVEFATNSILLPVPPPLALALSTDIAIVLNGLFQWTAKDFLKMAAENGIKLEEEEFALSEQSDPV